MTMQSFYSEYGGAARRAPISPLHLLARACTNALASPSHTPLSERSRRTILLLARRSISEALMLRDFRVDHLSVRTCEQWQHP